MPDLRTCVTLRRVLVEMSVTEQRYRAVLEVEAGMPVTEVADRFGVSRQAVHRWLRWCPGRVWRARPTGRAGRTVHRDRPRPR